MESGIFFFFKSCLLTKLRYLLTLTCHNLKRKKKKSYESKKKNKMKILNSKIKNLLPKSIWNPFSEKITNSTQIWKYPNSYYSYMLKISKILNFSTTHPLKKVMFQICSPNSLSTLPKALLGFPRDKKCFQRLINC